jgi:hypothetical protein
MQTLPVTPPLPFTVVAEGNQEPNFFTVGAARQ